MTFRKLVGTWRTSAMGVALAGAMIVSGVGLEAMAAELLPSDSLIVAQSNTKRVNQVRVRYAERSDKDRSQPMGEMHQVEDSARGSGPDAPEEVRSFVDYVEQQNLEYTRNGLEHLSNAVGSLIQEDQQELRQRYEQLKNRIDEFKGMEDANQQNQVGKELFTQTVQLMQGVQQQYYPQLQQQVQNLQQQAQQLQGDQNLNQQGDKIHQFFMSSSQAIEQMASTQPQMPGAALDTDSDAIGGGPDESDEKRDYDKEKSKEQKDSTGGGPEESDDYQDHEEHQQIEEMQEQDDPMGGGPDDLQDQKKDVQEEPLGGGPMISEEVRSFTNFVQQQQQRGVGEQAEQYTYDGLRHLNRALGALVPSGETSLQQRQEVLSQRISQLEQTREEANHGQLVREAFVDSAQFLKSLQEQHHPDYNVQAQQVQQTAAALRPQDPIAQQSDTIERFFQQASNALQAIDQQRQQQQN